MKTTQVTRKGLNSDRKATSSTITAKLVQRMMRHALAGGTLLLVALALGACTATTYNIDFHPGAFRVAKTLKVEPGQAGDDGSSTASGATTGGKDGAPGGSNLLRGFAQQGNIFQIGTSQAPETTAKTAATVNSPNSKTDAGGDEPAPPVDPDNPDG